MILWRQGLTISSLSKKGFYFLFYSKAISLDASSIAKLSQLLLPCIPHTFSVTQSQALIYVFLLFQFGFSYGVR